MSEMRRRKADEAEIFGHDKDEEIVRLKAELARAQGSKVGAQGSKVEPAQLAKHDEDDGAEMKEALIKEIQEGLIKSVKQEVTPGTSHEAKRVKDLLLKDPFNMSLIFEVGRAYAVDKQWDRSVNVMLRGWKRVPDLLDHEVRFAFLTILCQGSLITKKYKQALAVLNDSEEPTDKNGLPGFLVMSCQVYGYNGDMARSLKSFNRAIEDDSDFDAMLAVWVGCMPALKKVGAYDAARSSLEMKLETDEEKEKLKAYEKLAEIRQQLSDATEDKPMSGSTKIMMSVLFLVFLCVIVFFLYKLEAWSLANLKPK